MKSLRTICLAGMVAALLMASLSGVAQQASGSAPAAVATGGSVVPHLISYSGVLKDGSGRVITAMTGVTFLIYKDEQGGAPLWLETQNVTPGQDGALQRAARRDQRQRLARGRVSERRGTVARGADGGRIGASTHAVSGGAVCHESRGRTDPGRTASFGLRFGRAAGGQSCPSDDYAE